MIDLVYKIYKNNKILKIIDLNPITSEKELYDLLNPLYKEKFNDDERIICFCQRPLIKMFDDYPADTLIWLQKILAQIDIGNFFCEIVSYYDMNEDLKIIQQRFALKDNPIRNFVITKDLNV